MEIKVGQFGRFWDSVRPEDDYYTYGFLDRIDEEDKEPYATIEGTYWENFEPADPQPGWPQRRRVILDRKKLLQILIDGGFLPDNKGNFESVNMVCREV